MTMREIDHALVDVIHYDYLWPPTGSEDAVHGFTHSREVNEICADMLPPHVVTPVEKAVLEDALDDYVKRRNIGEADQLKILAWLAQMPDEIAIMERTPNPSG